MMKQQEEVEARYCLHNKRALSVREKNCFSWRDLIAGLHLPKVSAPDLSGKTPKPRSSLRDTHHEVSAKAHSAMICSVGVTAGRGLSNSERRTTGLPTGQSPPGRHGHSKHLQAAKLCTDAWGSPTPNSAPPNSGSSDLGGDRATPPGDAAGGRFVFLQLWTKGAPY